MSNRQSRPFPFARTIVSLTAVTMFSAFAAQALVPDGRPAYDIVNAAAISVRPDTVGVADSDLYFSTPEQINTTLDAMQALGVTNVRVLIPWYDVNPDPGVYNWSKIDGVINAASARNMGVLATITHSPDWAVTPGDTPVISPPANVRDYGDFTALVAARYAGRISAYEIWNEPNGASSFYPSPDPARYTALLKDAYAKIKAVDPSVTVIAGVLGAVPTRPAEGTVDSPTFLQQMYDAGAQGYFDALSFHPYQYGTKYSQGPDLVGSPINEVREMRALMVSKGDAAKLIWASEYGLPTNVVTEAQQAAFIADFLDSWSAQNYAGPMFIYTTRDGSGDFESDMKFGIFREDWTPKAAAQVIADYIRAHPQTTVVPDTAAQTNLVELVIRAVSQLAQSIVMTVQQFISSFFRAIASVFAPPAVSQPLTTNARLAVTGPSSTTLSDTADASAPSTSSVSSPTTTSADRSTQPTTTLPSSTAAASTVNSSTSSSPRETTTTSAPETSTPTSSEPVPATTTPSTTAEKSTVTTDTTKDATELKPVATAGAVS